MIKIDRLLTELMIYTIEHGQNPSMYDKISYKKINDNQKLLLKKKQETIKKIHEIGKLDLPKKRHMRSARKKISTKKRSK